MTLESFTPAPLPREQLDSMLVQMDALYLPPTDPTLPPDIHVTEPFILRGLRRGMIYSSAGEAYDLGQEDGGGYPEWVDQGYVEGHSLVVTLVNDVIHEAIESPEVVRQWSNLAAWMHDSNKKSERTWQRALETAEQSKEALRIHFTTAKKLPTAERLKHLVNIRLRQGEMEQLPTVADRQRAAIQAMHQDEEWENEMMGIPSFVNKLMRANEPPSRNGHDTLQEKIMWLADACVSWVTIVPIEQRMLRSINDPVNGQRTVARSDSYRERYGGDSLFEVQFRLAESYVHELSGRIGIEPEEFYTWLSSKVHERVVNGQLPPLPSV